MPSDDPRLQAMLNLIRLLPDAVRASMVAMYLQALDEQLAIIEAGLSGAGEPEVVAGALHKISGSAGMMQDHGLSQAVRSVELAWRNGDVEAARQHWPELAACAVTTREALVVMQAQDGSPG